MYLTLYFLVVLAASYVLLTSDKLSIHVEVNKIVGNKAIDTFYKYFTHVGDGVFVVIVGVILLFFNRKRGFYVLMTYAVAGLTSSLLKLSVNYVRPFHYFKYYQRHLHLKLVDGVDMIGERSFPSGHSIAAFAVFTAIAFSVENQFLKFLMFVIACNAAFSRMYISQHWLVDIFSGSLIGFVYATVLYFAYYGNRGMDGKPALLFKLKQ